MNDDVKNKKTIFTTELIEYYTNLKDNGYVLKKHENPWLDNETGVRKPGLIFKMTSEEQEEYVKCALDIVYFAEKYCKIKNEEGVISNVKLRDYQIDILNNFYKYRFNILLASRQSGKTITTSIFLLHTALFNNDKNIMIIANKSETSMEIIDKIKSIYINLPFFLKCGVNNWNLKSIIFENGCKIKSTSRTKSPGIGFSIDVLYMDEFAHIPSNILEPYYRSAFPTVTAIKNSKIIISSTPNSTNLFYKLVTDAERPEGDPLKNNYKCTRVYWYQVPDRFVTYVRLNNIKLNEYGYTKEDVFNVIKEKWGEHTKIEMKYSVEHNRYVINVYNNEKCSEIDIKTLELEDKRGSGDKIPLKLISDISTWKEEVIKDIGGEDAFNQEYNLKFISSSRGVLEDKVLDEIIKYKKPYVYKDIHLLDKKLNFNYSGLMWVDDINTFDPSLREKYKIIMSIDISEGLGQDYSVINIFKLTNKNINEIENTSNFLYKSIVDFYRLEQIGLYRSNVISINKLAQIFYILAFEYFNPENVRVVLELNNYGNVFLSELKNVFNGNNEYAPFVFFKYKHRADSEEEKIGLKVNENKNSILVKKYQELITNKYILVNNEETIKEMLNFVKHITPSGNIKYSADFGNDDIVMTIVNATTVFEKNDFIQMINEWMEYSSNQEFSNYINNKINGSEGVFYNNGMRYSDFSDMVRKAKSGTHFYSVNIKDFYFNRYNY